MDYGSLLSRAWQITLRHRILWLFGILSALGTGGGGGNSNFRFGGARTDGNVIPPEVQRQFERPEVVAVILVVACIALVIALVLFVLSIIGRGGLIGGVRLAEEHGALTFGEAWSVGTRYFWRMLGIVLLTLIPAILIALFTGFIGVVAAVTLGIGALCLIPLLCLLILAFIPIGIIAHFAQFGVVLDDLGVVDAFRRGWQVLQTNLGPIILLGLLVIVIGFIAGLILVAPFFAIIFPTILITALGGGRVDTTALALAGLGVLCYLPIAIVLAGIIHTWTTAVWTLAYEQFTGRAPAVIPPQPTPPPVPA